MKRSLDTNDAPSSKKCEKNLYFTLRQQGLMRLIHF